MSKSYLFFIYLFVYIYTFIYHVKYILNQILKFKQRTCPLILFFFSLIKINNFNNIKFEGGLRFKSFLKFKKIINKYLISFIMIKYYYLISIYVKLNLKKKNN